jgi:hypothetical protein
MFGRDNGFGVPVVAGTTDGAEGREKRVELFVGESNSAEEDERTEKRDGGGCADMTEMRLRLRVQPESDQMSSRFVSPLQSPSITSEEVSQRPALSSLQ